MQKVKSPYKVFNSYCLRTPLFSYSDYRRILRKKNFGVIDFRKILENKVFREALFLASPSLLFQIEKWEKGLITDLKKEKRLLNSILKYYTRISTRCTPFGLFASCCIGNFNKETLIELTELNNYQRISRFDTVFLSLLKQMLLQDTSIRKHLRFFTNSTLYFIKDHYRYIEYRIENNKKEYSLEGIVSSNEIKAIVEATRDGKTIDQLKKLIQKHGITETETKDFINELIRHQILVSELELTLTNEDYFTELIRKISNMSSAKQNLLFLKTLQHSLKRLDDSFGNSPVLYNDIIVKIKGYFQDLDTHYLFQTDCFSGVIKNTLQNQSQKKIRQALHAFNKMTNASKNHRLENFKKAFSQHFGSEEVPLSLALDLETGVGYGLKKDTNAPLLEEILSSDRKSQSLYAIWSDFDIFLHKKLVECFRKNDGVLYLSEKDLEHFPEQWKDLPDTFSSIIELYKRGDQEILYIQSAGGASAVNLLGRFSHGTDTISKHIEEIFSVEAQMNSDLILAEIIHLPEDRTGNVIHRKTTRTYEIPYLGQSNVSPDYQIPINDLMVSVKNDSIILRSKKLNKQVIPRLGNAHAYGDHSLPIYQFLCELQTQKKRGAIGFYWSSIFLHLPFLPRVVFDDIIFSKARWNIEVQTIKEYLNSHSLLETMNHFQHTNRLPDQVELVEGDNRLLICLKNENSFEMLYESIKNKKQFILEEFLFTDDEVVTRGKKSFCNQFVVSFYNEEKLYGRN
jgi:hypothetical protein